MLYLDKLGWPVETIKGRHIQNFIRRLIHTRKIRRNWIPSVQTPSINVTTPRGD